MVLKGFQTSDDGRLLLVLGHVSAFDKHLSVCIGSKRVQGLLVIAGYYRNTIAVSLCYAKCLNASRRYVYH